MIVLWVTLLVLHQGYTLIPVITVQPGEPATLTCLSNDEVSSKTLYWYKQSAGDTLKLIAKLVKSATPEYEPEFNHSRFKVCKDKNFSNLTILRTTQEDEGMYHCEIIDWKNPEWSGTYLLVKGNTERTSNYTVVQLPTVSDPDHPGDSVTLQCSVLSEYENKTCPGVHSVYWFRTRSNASHPDIIYTDGSSRDKCVYQFSKNISSSDDGTYHCAVATCGEILFGNGTKLDLVQTTHSPVIGIVIFIVCLAISVAYVVFICNRSQEQCKGMESTISEAPYDNLRQQRHYITDSEYKMIYTAMNFSEREATRRRKKKEDSVYSTVQYHLVINSDSNPAY